MNITMKLTEEQFEALDVYIEAKAREVVDAKFNDDTYSSDEREAAWDLLVEGDQE